MSLHGRPAQANRAKPQGRPQGPASAVWAGFAGAWSGLAGARNRPGATYFNFAVPETYLRYLETKHDTSS